MSQSMRACLRFFCVALIAELSAVATTFYSVTDFCAPNTCRATVLNEEGQIAGPGFVYYSDRKVFVPLGENDIPLAINSLGDVVGMTIRGTINRSAFLYVSDLAARYDLFAAFGAGAGIASSINDARQIVGMSFDPDVPPYPGNGPLQFGGIPLRVFTQAPVKINNAGQMIANSAADTSGFAGGLLFTPGRGLTHLPGLAVAINNRGLVLLKTGFSQFATTDASGALTPIPLDPPLPVDFIGINDNGELVGTVGGPDNPPLAFIQPLGLQGAPLGYFIRSDRAWNLGLPTAINNRGEILVEGTYGTRVTSLLLTPIAP
ncbi:MAG: motif putative anchor domain protein [Bryobacterales bacterium]|nr:motif putative anchor domain protein [Bryobacterales bacterium]